MSDFQLPTITTYQKSKLLAYASQVLEAQQQMVTDKGKNIIHYTLRKKRKHVRMEHYPLGDRIDRETGAQYFYHCHRENYESAEHGHFHCFLRHSGIPKSIKPTPLADWDKNIDSPMAHLVAISMNCYGQPIRLFTVNRWISYEVWYDAKHILPFLRRYHLTLTDDPYWMVLDQWVEGILHLFAPQIAWLHTKRDEAIMHHQRQFPEVNAYEDEALEELSSIDIDLTKQIQWLLTHNKIQETA